MSFKLTNPSTSVIIPNLDRLVQKLGTAEDEVIFTQNSDVAEGLNQLIDHQSLKLNDALGEQCFLSFTAEDLTVAFDNPDLSYSDLSTFLNDQFGANASYREGVFQLNDRTFETAQFGAFTVFSTVPINPDPDVRDYLETNADYSVILDTTATDRYILANEKRFRVWNENKGPVRGNPIAHSELILKAPKNFDHLHFYGSQRFSEDKTTFFESPGEEAFSWINNGLVILKKDSFELMIARQNDERDLKLLLEEQTLEAQGDTAQLNFLTVKNVQIMSFETQFNWQASIPGLTDELRYYGEFQNFNVLANSFAAMRWYLAEIQTGSLVEEDEWLLEQYQQSTPKNCHLVEIESTADGILIHTGTWMEKNKCANTQSFLSLNGNSGTDSDESIEFSVPFAPNSIFPFTQKGNQMVLVSGPKHVMMVENGKEIWQVPLDQTLISAPEQIDLENDGIFEWALFLKNEFKVLRTNGEQVPGLSRKLNKPLKGGLCANYDLRYDYRFFLVSNQSITCINEKGETVTGWTYQGSQVPLTGASFYTQIAGKDYLCFKDINNQLIILNRRGESRFVNQTASNLPNESHFVTGRDERVLHKLGYQNQFIYNRYIKDGYTDSVKLDKRVNAVSAEWIMLNEPRLLIEEPGRVILFNVFGYVEQEILKPQNASTFLGMHATPEIYYVFFDNSNNSLYLLNKDGKMILSNLANNSRVYGINARSFYTINRQIIKEHKLN